MKQYTWTIFLAIGILILVFAAYNAFYIPALDPADPDEGWEWLTTDPQIIEYIKFNFRVLGIWVMGFGLLVTITAVGGYRHRQRWAWYAMWVIPLILTILAFMMPWTIHILSLLFLAALVGLLWSRPIFFGPEAI